jgi:AraC-like DNA-binding protein
MSEVGGVLGSFQRLTTRSVRPKDQFDFWREQFQFVHMEPTDKAARLEFDGEVLAFAGDHGLHCAHVRTGPQRSVYGGRDSNTLLLGGILSDRARVADDSGERIFQPADGLLLMDCDRRARLETFAAGYEFIYVAIPRDLAAAALGRREVLPARSALTRVPTSGVGSLLWSNMQSLVRYGESLTPQQCAVAMASVTDLGIAVLRDVARDGDDGKRGASLYVAATAYIARHYGRINLTADHVGAALGCSRAQLYRAFSQHDDSVADHLRRFRLRAACALLARGAENRIGQIAFDCGYTDPAAFGKAFRRQYGVSPSEWCARIHRETPCRSN